VWKKEEHWQPLWEDLQLVVSELMDRQADADTDIER
jgi:hypothetical protein